MVEYIALGMLHSLDTLASIVEYVALGMLHSLDTLASMVGNVALGMVHSLDTFASMVNYVACGMLHSLEALASILDDQLQSRRLAVPSTVELVNEVLQTCHVMLMTSRLSLIGHEGLRLN